MTSYKEARKLESMEESWCWSCIKLTLDRAPRTTLMSADGSTCIHIRADTGKEAYRVDVVEQHSVRFSTHCLTDMLHSYVTGLHVCCWMFEVAVLCVFLVARGLLTFLWCDRALQQMKLEEDGV